MSDSIQKSFKVTMDDDEYALFRQIKKEFGVRADAEVLRILIRYYHKKETEEGKVRKGS